MPNRHHQPSSDRRLRPTGGYRKLRSFQTTTLIFDGTVAFCDRFISGYSRTHDQMVQAARSGRQNIAEGNRAGGVSTKSELKLTNVARASLEELLLDFQDYLRQHDLPLWPKDYQEAQQIRALGAKIRNAPEGSPLADPDDPGDRERRRLYQPFLQSKDPTVAANSLICLIHQANYLLDQQLIGMEQSFVEGGGYSEQLATARIAHRRKADRKDRTDPSDPADHPDAQHLEVLPLPRRPADRALPAAVRDGPPSKPITIFVLPAIAACTAYSTRRWHRI